LVATPTFDWIILSIKDKVSTSYVNTIYYRDIIHT